ncbi:MAG: LytR/AlgR family response regulator transcription factor [Clostridiaceae bacterium]
MIKVFVCEDEDVQRKRLTKIIEDIILIENYDMEVSLSSTRPQDIIDYVRGNLVIGLYFFDIDLNSHIDGIQLAAEVRKYDPNGFIVFISSHSDMSSSMFKYKVEAMDYIEKRIFDDFPNKIRQCIVEANKRYTTRTPINIQTKYVFKTEDRLINIELEKILFFKTSAIKNRIELYGLNCLYDLNGSLKDIEDEFQDSFYRCHKSYLVNKDNIKEINLKKKVIYMVDGQECPISVRQALKLMKNNFIS